MKDTYYFSHDYNARADEKMIKLLKVMKWEGYGLFWALVEKLYEAGGEIEYDLDCIAYDLRTESDRIKPLCEDFELFYQKVGKLRSLSVDRRLQHRAEKSEKARESAYSRWGNANALRPHIKRNAIKERKGKERKGKERKEEEKKEEDKQKEVQAPFVLPDWINKKSWQDFSEMRKRLRKPLTGRATELIIIELDKLRQTGNDPKNVLEQSVMNSYQGVFPLREDFKKKSSGCPPIKGKYDGIGEKV